MIPSIEVVAPGLMSTVQDLGRFGHQAQGVPVSGALDPGNLRLANALVGNAQGMGALELRILGPTLKVAAQSVRVALTGSDGFIDLVEPRGKPVPANRTVMLEQGQVFRISSVADSAVCYLAVEGGFDLPLLYGSQSTYVSGGLGGFEGRALQAGDFVPLCKGSVEADADRICFTPLRYSVAGPVRVVLGPQSDYFSDEGLQTFLSEDFSFSNESNRMGVRLSGPEVAHSKGADINSDGIVTGSVQVPGNGLPIILLADHQTTGGYPKIGTIASADLARLGRMSSGAKVRFAALSVAEAEEARRALEQQILACIDAIVPLPNEEQMFNHLLHSANLICGVWVD
ncbi:biotin-dependent carboxyltransferase family protein [Cohaesibacter celericrescens]|uniref:5-oxoprolinase subunit C family protein n=1 Tax=Cohaesibacter celericrescens TaxID=2067669 RepID=UPI00356AA24B